MGLLSIGGLYAWGVYGALLVSVAGLMFFSLDRFRRNGSIRIQWPFWTAVGLAIISLIQVIPLPTGVMRALSPEIYGRMRAVYTLAGLPFHTHSIALNSPSALFSVNKFLAAGFIFLLTMNLSHKLERGIKLASILVIMGVALVLIAVFSLILTPGSVLGIYSPSSMNRPWLVSLLISPNNLSAVLNLTGFTAIGLYARSKRRTSFLVAAIILEAGALMTLSRAGMAGAVVGIALFLVMGASGFRRRLTVWILVPVLLAAFFVFVMAFNRSTVEIGTGTSLVRSASARLNLASTGLQAFIHAPFTGIGQMGFGDFYRIFGGPYQWATFFFIENEPVQYLADFGVLGLLIMGIFITWLVHTLIIAKKDGPTTGLSIGLIVLLLQGLVDFNPEMPGVLFMVAVALGTLYGLGTHGRTKREGRFFRSRQSGRGLLIVLVLSGLVTGSLVFALGPRKMVNPAPDIDKSTGVQTFILSRLPSDVFSVVDPVVSLSTLSIRHVSRNIMTSSMILGRLNDVVGKNPLNPRPYASAARAFMVAGDADFAIKLARAALLLAPYSVEYRLLLVDLMASSYHFKDAAVQAHFLLKDAASANKLIHLLTSIPGGIKTASYLANDYGFLKKIMSFMRYHVKNGRKRLCRLVLTEYPKNCLCRGFMIQQYVAKGGALDKADLAATRLLGECPDEPYGYQTMGNVMLRENKKTEAYYMLMEARARLGKNLTVDDLLQMASIQIDLGYLDDARKNIVQARRKGRRYIWVGARAMLLNARILIKQGKLSTALLQIEAAVHDSPKDVNILNTALNMYARAGLLRKAIDICQKIYKITDNQQYKKREILLRNQIQMEILQKRTGGSK